MNSLQNFGKRFKQAPALSRSLHVSAIAVLCCSAGAAHPHAVRGVATHPHIKSVTHGSASIHAKAIHVSTAHQSAQYAHLHNRISHGVEHFSSEHLETRVAALHGSRSLHLDAPVYLSHLHGFDHDNLQQPVGRAVKQHDHSLAAGTRHAEHAKHEENVMNSTIASNVHPEHRHLVHQTIGSIAHLTFEKLSESDRNSGG